ncbi:hypothetical protein NXC12_CH01053 [Rhizobium etli]|uniref:Uncharacterized protein n=1 Tax=Rhizobium etli TaxID=29449 RepID=A0AAN1EIX2_RHIET|nr:hypothetical protein NXC12_CH01053 [Rhizobium etli]
MDPRVKPWDDGGSGARDGGGEIVPGPKAAPGAMSEPRVRRHKVSQPQPSPTQKQTCRTQPSGVSLARREKRLPPLIRSVAE